MAKNKKKRQSMGKSTRGFASNRKTNKKWLNVPQGVDMFEPKGGKTYKFDVVPFVVKNIKNHPDKDQIPEDIWWRMAYGLHRNIGPDKRTMVCPSFIGKKCKACDERRELYDDPDVDNKVAGQLKASPRSIFLIRHASGTEKGKIQAFDISDFCFLDQVLTEIDLGEPEWANFADLEGGYTLKVRFTEETIGDGKNTFPKADRVDFLEREDIDEEILNEVAHLDEMVVFPSSEEMEKAFYGIDEEDEEGGASEEDDEDEDEDEDEPEEEEGEEEEEEEEEDLESMSLKDLKALCKERDVEIPKKAKKNDLIKLLEEEAELAEEPEEDEEEEEEEKKPKKGKGKSTKGKNKKEDAGKGKKKDKCPHGHKFGEEFEDHDDCDEDGCGKYEECLEEFDKLN